MSLFFLIISFGMALLNLIQSRYFISTKKEIQEARNRVLKYSLEKKGISAESLQSSNNFSSFFELIFIVFYYIGASIVMTYPLVSYYSVLLVILSISRYFYLRKLFIVENVKKSWSSAFLFILSLAFSVLYINFYFTT